MICSLEKFASEASYISANMYFFSRKLRKSHFLFTAQKKISIFVQFSLCSNLFSKLKKSCTKESIYILQFSKNDSNATFLYKKNFFVIVPDWIFFSVTYLFSSVFNLKVFGGFLCNSTTKIQLIDLYKSKLVLYRNVIHVKNTYLTGFIPDGCFIVQNQSSSFLVH